MGPSHLIFRFVLRVFFCAEASIPPSRKVPMPRAPSTAATKKRKKEPETEQTKRWKTTKKEVQPASSLLALLSDRILPLTILCCNASDATSTACRTPTAREKGDLRVRCLRRDADEDEVCLPSTAATKEPETEKQKNNNEVTSSTTQQSFSAAE